MDIRLIRLAELQEWFSKEFLIRKEAIRMCKYFGITPPEREYDLMREGYVKMQELRELKGLPKLDEQKDILII